MKKTLLYFEEYKSNLSKKLEQRTDINLLKIRAVKTMDKYFTDEELREPNVYYFDTDSDFESQMYIFKNWLSHHKINIDYFLNDSEYYLEISNRIANNLGLDSLSDLQTGWVRDKVFMKDRFNEIGLKTVNYMAVESKDDIIKFFHRNGDRPIVFKPRKGMNSIKVYTLNTLDDIYNLDVDIKYNKYMVESFCNDHEWSIESIIQDGIVLDSYLTYIPNPTLWATLNNAINCHMTVPQIPSYFKFIPKEFIQTIVSGMELKNGVMTIEVFVDENGYVIPSELGWRLPGCQATSNHSISYGIDIYNILIDIAIQNKVKLDYRDKIVSVGDLYLPNKAGVITEITPYVELMKMDGVIDGEMFARLGEYQQKRRVGNDASGWVQVVGKDENDTLKKMQNIFDEFKIESDDSIKERGASYVKKI